MTIPQNQAAERALLSILHHSPQCLTELPCKADLFQHPAHKAIFGAIEQAEYAGHPTNEIAITSALEAAGKLQIVGGPGTLNELLFTFHAPNPRQAGYFHRQLVDAHVARETLKVTQDSLGDLTRMRLHPVQFAEKISNAAQGPELIERCTLTQQLDDLIAELERQEPREAFPTGLTPLDLALDGGVHRGEVLVVAGETSGGKSVLLAQAALACLQAGGKAVALFSLEMPARDILKRMAANLSGCRIKSIRERPTKHEMGALSNAVTNIYSMPLTIVDSIASLTAIEAEARRLIRLKRADVIIVDYLQLVENSGAETREACMAEVARKFKNLALAGQCAVLTASQLNEEGRLRESRAIGHHADVVINIGDGALVVAKNRRGARNISIPVTLRGELGRFEER